MKFKTKNIKIKTGQNVRAVLNGNDIRVYSFTSNGGLAEQIVENVADGGSIVTIGTCNNCYLMEPVEDKLILYSSGFIKLN